MTLDEAQSLVARVRHWHHRFEIHPGLVTPGAYDPGFLLDMLQLPARLDGLRVLDVGTSDGYFAQALWRRGAAVTAAGGVAIAGAGPAATAVVPGKGSNEFDSTTAIRSPSGVDFSKP